MINYKASLGPYLWNMQEHGHLEVRLRTVAVASSSTISSAYMYSLYFPGQSSFRAQTDSLKA